MKFSYFPGCTMTTTGIEYGKSMRYVNEKLGVVFEEIPDWNCCGATAGHSVSRGLGLALPARNVALCERQKLGLPIAVPCAACYARMKDVTGQVRGDSEMRRRISDIIEMPVTGELDVLNLIEVYTRPGIFEKLAAAVENRLGGLRVACYYGCLLVRPSKVTGAANAECPEAMERLMRVIGAEPIDWAYQTECCGGSHHVDLPKAAKKPTRLILQNARANGAQAIATACPLCMMNLDMRQNEINREQGEHFDIPVFFFTELIAAAMGGDPDKIGISTHFYPAGKLIEGALRKGGES